MNQFNQLVDRIPSELENLENLIQHRKHFEEEVDQVTQWLLDTEMVLNTELKTDSLHVIQEQRQQVHLNTEKFIIMPIFNG